VRVLGRPLRDGSTSELQAVPKHNHTTLRAPIELYDLLVFLGAPARYAVKRVFNYGSGEIAAVSSTDKLSLIAGRYVGKDDPTMLVRCQGSFPAVGEVLEPFATAYTVEGWMRGSHNGPLMPVGLKDAHPARFDGPPRLVALGFQLADGKLNGPNDMFDDPSFNNARQEANNIADYLRKHGPFEPHRLPLDEMGYTTMPLIRDKLAGRSNALEEAREHAMEGPMSGRE